MASNRQSLSTTIIKQGYLKKKPNATKLGSTFRKATLRWFVFGVIRHSEPYLEYYESEEAIFTSMPINHISLRRCKYIHRSINLQKQGRTFTLTMPDRILSLEASNRHGMLEWCTAIENKLATLGILDKSEKENIYSTSIPRSAKKPLQVPRRPPPPLPESDDESSPLTAEENTTSLGTVENPPSPRTAENPPSLINAELPPSLRTAENPVTLRTKSLHINTHSPIESPANKSECPPVSPNITPDFLRLESLYSVSQKSDNRAKRATIAIMQNTANGHLEDNFLRLNSEQLNRGASRQLFPESGQGAEVYGELWSRPTEAPPIPERQNIPTTPTSPTSPPGLTRQDSRPLTFVSGQARTPDGRDPHAGPMRVGSRTPSTGLPPLSPMSEDGYCSPVPSTPTTPGTGGAVPPSPLSISVYPETPSAMPTRGLFGAAGGTPAPEVVTTDAGDGENSIIPDKMMEALGLADDSGVFGWNAPPPEDFNAPPVYQPRGVLNRGSNKALKFSQVEQLQKEMDHAGGVKVVLRRIDCLYTVAWVNAFNRVWVSGWIQQQRPFLHTAFHVGDQVISVNGQVVENARMVHKLVKHCSENDKITFILKRIPYARVFAVKREEDSQDLGIRREGGTGEIISVDPYSLLSTSGLSSKATTADGTNLCNWFITEINSRTVNMFFKGDEIEKRLNAVGKEISILVQPVDFIQELKKQLKTNFKNYKDFIVQ